MSELQINQFDLLDYCAVTTEFSHNTLYVLAKQNQLNLV